MPTSPSKPRAITDLLDSHRDLLNRHHVVLVELMAVAIKSGLSATEMAFIVADTLGDFGQAVLESGPGIEFLLRGKDGTETMVVPLNTFGLVEILEAMIPEGVEPVMTRAVNTVSILVVDEEDEPAIVLMDVEDLVRVRQC